MAVGTATGQVLLYDIRSKQAIFCEGPHVRVAHQRRGVSPSAGSDILDGQFSCEDLGQKQCWFYPSAIFFKFCVRNSCYDTKTVS
jgi:hypothetical protein